MILRFGISISLLLYLLNLVNCNPVLGIFGVFQNASSLLVYKKALRELQRTEADYGLHLKTGSYGLSQFLKNIEQLKKNITQNNSKRNIVFTDMHSIQKEIMEGILNDRENKSTNSSQLVTVDNHLSGEHQLSLHLRTAEDMLRFLDRFSRPVKTITIIVDDTEMGHRTLMQLTEVAPSFNVKIVNQKILSKPIEKNDFLTTIKYGNTEFFLDCDGKDAVSIFKLANNVGAAGIDKDIKWILSKRTMDSLPLSCGIPAGSYYGIRPQEPAMNSSYIVDIVNLCQKQDDKLQLCQTRFETAITYRLWNNEKAEMGKSWAKLNDDQILSTDESQAENPFLPRLRVAVAETAPWLMTASFSQNYNGNYDCGREGRIGVRRKNGINETVCFFGFAMAILKAVEEKLHFVGEVQISSDGKYGTYNEETGKADGVVGDLVDGEADLGIDLIEDKTRNKVIDFSTPYAITSIAIAYRQQSQYKESGIFGPFSPQLWLGVIGTIAVLVVIVWIWERFSPYGQYQVNKRTLEDSKAFGLDDSANYIMGTFFTGEIIDQKPRTFGSHVAIIVISFVSILVISAYSANLITFLVVLDDEPIVTGLSDPKLVGDSSQLRVGIHSSTVISGYLNSHHDPRIREMAKTRVTGFDLFEDAIFALKSRKIDMIIYDYHSLAYTQSMDRECDIKILQLQNAQVGIGLSFSKKSTWKRRFNLAVISMVNSGQSDTIASQWFKLQHCVKTNNFYSLDIRRMASLFIWLSIGILGCVMIFAIVFFIRCLRRLCIKKEDQ